MSHKIKVEPQVHKIWQEFQLLKSELGYEPLHPIIGKWQYIYSSPKGKISLVELPDYFMDGITLWEIYSLEGNVFYDIERFHSKIEAEQQIRKYLE